MSEPNPMQHCDRPWKCWCGAKGGLGNHDDGEIPRHVRPDGKPCRQNDADGE